MGKGSGIASVRSTYGFKLGDLLIYETDPESYFSLGENFLLNDSSYLNVTRTFCTKELWISPNHSWKEIKEISE